MPFEDEHVDYYPEEEGTIEEPESPPDRSTELIRRRRDDTGAVLRRRQPTRRPSESSRRLPPPPPRPSGRVARPVPRPTRRARPALPERPAQRTTQRVPRPRPSERLEAAALPVPDSNGNGTDNGTSNGNGNHPTSRIVREDPKDRANRLFQLTQEGEKPSPAAHKASPQQAERLLSDEEFIATRSHCFRDGQRLLAYCEELINTKAEGDPSIPKLKRQFRAIDSACDHLNDPHVTEKELLRAMGTLRKVANTLFSMVLRLESLEGDLDSIMSTFGIDERDDNDTRRSFNLITKAQNAIFLGMGIDCEDKKRHRQEKGLQASLESIATLLGVLIFHRYPSKTKLWLLCEKQVNEIAMQAFQIEKMFDAEILIKSIEEFKWHSDMRTVNGDRLNGRAIAIPHSLKEFFTRFRALRYGYSTLERELRTSRQRQREHQDTNPYEELINEAHGLAAAILLTAHQWIDVVNSRISHEERGRQSQSFALAIKKQLEILEGLLPEGTDRGHTRRRDTRARRYRPLDEAPRSETNRGIQPRVIPEKPEIDEETRKTLDAMWGEDDE